MEWSTAIHTCEQGQSRFSLVCTAHWDGRVQVFRQSDLAFVRILDAIRCCPFPAGLLSVGDDPSRTTLCVLSALLLGGPEESLQHSWQHTTRYHSWRLWP